MCLVDPSSPPSSSFDLPKQLHASLPSSNAAVSSVDFAALSSDDGVLALCEHIHRDGLAIVRHVPSVPGTVRDVAERIAPISHTHLYGSVFDVVAEHNPVNIAYTSERLKLHLDLAYYESPPGLQLLHALRYDATVQGGTLVTAMFWSPPFEGVPTRIPAEKLPAYYAAYRALDEIIQENVIEFKLKQGELVVFNQRSEGESAFTMDVGRMLHGREAFESKSDGVRHLQGTYVNIDDFLCRFQSLRHQHDKTNTLVVGHTLRVGNQSY
ncbi:hypothetical protein DYB38_005997 [Aphanomyces astaci]|uniref:TauD/TfdA-like domain-containing protein n=1 Tax=Aphanomyces astaci TaxID=112090 RepID=A0A397DWY3_APHAT|nr:hypothetical protein DYB38_005997 [Aphanomyces astaci]